MITQCQVGSAVPCRSWEQLSNPVLLVDETAAVLSKDGISTSEDHRSCLPPSGKPAWLGEVCGAGESESGLDPQVMCGLLFSGVGSGMDAKDLPGVRGSS